MSSYKLRCDTEVAPGDRVEGTIVVRGIATELRVLSDGTREVVIHALEETIESVRVEQSYAEMVADTSPAPASPS